MLEEAGACFASKEGGSKEIRPLPEYLESLNTLRDSIQPFLDTLAKDTAHAEVLEQLVDSIRVFAADIETFRKAVEREQAAWKKQKKTNGALKEAVDRLASLAETSRDLTKQADLIYKLASRLIDICETVCRAKESDKWANREVARGRKAVDLARQAVTEQLKQVRYFHRHAYWLTERFPEAKLRDIEGLVKLVGTKEIEANDWSLTPGRYVGVTPEEEDDNFDFEEALRDIHIELEGLNTEAADLAAQIAKSFKDLGI
jgi:type I restriction enzyme M protein